jgi:hypothetical protein
MELLRRAARALAAGAILAFAPASLAQVATEAAVKAAYLYKFVGYIEWPPTAFAAPDAPVVIATLAADEVAAELESAVAGRQVNGRRVVVRRLREGEAPQGVHVLFIGRRAGDGRAALRLAQQHRVLVVTETGLDSGGAINFVVADDRVAFEVSLDAAERGGHRISSRMLAVARRVLPKAPS